MEDRPTDANRHGWSDDDDPRRPEQVLAWGLKRWGERIVVVTSFQAEGTVLIDMAHRIDPQVRVATVDTGRLPDATFDLIERVQQRYGLAVEIHCPEHFEVEELVAQGGPNLFRRCVDLRHRCCEVRKVAPFERILNGCQAWITGLRREQVGTRERVRQFDMVDSRARLSPLAHWSHDEVWSYIRDRNLPYHELYDQGYTSIGCAPCTRPPLPGGDARSGRWWWEQSAPKECGLHALKLAKRPSARAVGGAR